MKKRILIIALLFSLLLTSCVSEHEMIARSKAYIISVGLDYTNTSRYSELLGSNNDAMDIAFCFQDIYTSKNIDSEITFMLSSGIYANESSVNYPTRENILEVIRNLKVTQDDIIVFFFSGHSSERQDGTAYLNLAKKDDRTETILDMGELYEELDAKGCACAMILSSRSI